MTDSLMDTTISTGTQNNSITKTRKVAIRLWDPLVQAIQTLKNISDVIPIGPLNVACSIALVIVQTVQAYFKVKEDFVSLGLRIAELVIAIYSECGSHFKLEDDIDDTDGTMHRGIRAKVELMLQTLTEIQDFIAKQARKNFIVRFLRTQELKDKLDSYNQRLDNAFKIFAVTSMIAIQQSQSSQSSQAHHKNSDSQWVLNEVAAWRRMRHPNIHGLLGYSAEHGVVAFSDYGHRHIRRFLDKQLLHLDPCTSFFTLARVLQGIASGVEYLRWNGSLTKADLEECGKEENCVVGSDGQVIIGHNLIIEDEHVEEDQRLTYREADEWLKEMFYMIGSKLIYGPFAPDWSDWKWVTASRLNELTRHARVLECVFCFIQPTFSSLVKDFETIVDVLRTEISPASLTASTNYNIQARSSITTTVPQPPTAFQRIRDVLLDICNKGISLCYIFRPLVPLNLDLLDVGYMRHSDGQFVRVENYRSRLESGLRKEPKATLMGASCYETAPVEGHEGLIRHRFYRPNYATVRRMTSSVSSSNIHDAWRIFAKDAERLFDEHSAAHPEMRIQDLILVTTIETDLRFSTLAWNGDDQSTLEPPSSVQYIDFYEYEHVEIGKPWGYWVIDNCHDDVWSGATIQETRCPQNIWFVQLEVADMVPVVTV